MSETTRETTIEVQAHTGKPYLGDPVVAEGLVRNFLTGVMERAVAAAEGKTTGEQAAQADQDAAVAFMKVISGQDDAYTPMGGWNANATGGLRAFVRAALAGVASDAMLAKPDGPIEAVAAYLLHETYRMLAEGTSGELDEEGMRARVDALAEDGTRLILGVPSEAALEAAADGQQT